MQLILLTTCLLLVAAMLGSLIWLANVRTRAVAQVVSVESADDSV
jgi:hypothetical protein